MHVTFLDGRDKPVLILDIEAEDRWEACEKAWELIWSGAVQAEDFDISEDLVTYPARPPNDVERSTFVHVALAKNPVLTVLNQKARIT